MVLFFIFLSCLIQLCFTQVCNEAYCYTSWSCSGSGQCIEYVRFCFFVLNKSVINELFDCYDCFFLSTKNKNKTNIEIVC